MPTTRSKRPKPSSPAASINESAGRPLLVVPRGPIPEAIADILQTEIISGKYAPGARLVERQIGDRFKVSSIPVREALQILETRGLVSKRPHRGCSVVDLTPREVKHMCELRDVLEPKVAEWAACRITKEGISRLTAHLDQLRVPAEEGSVPAFFYQDLLLHRCIWELSENSSAARALEAVVGSLFACGLRNAAVDLKQEFAKHERLCQAIVEGRPSDAALLLASISEGFRSQLYRRWDARSQSPAARTRKSL